MADGKCYREAALLFTLGPAIVLAQVNPAALQSTEKPGSKAALTRREVTPPRPVAGAAVSATVELQQRNALIAAVKKLTLFHSLKSGDSSEILQDLTNTTSGL